MIRTFTLAIMLGFAIATTLPSARAVAGEFDDSQADLQAEIQHELEELFSRNPQYNPNDGVFDMRSRHFDSTALAYLYLSAVREQYSALGVNVFEHKISREKKYLLYHDASHIFDELVPESFSFQRNLRLYYGLVPDLNAETKIALQKIKTFKELELLRSQMLHMMIEQVKGGPANPELGEVSQKIVEVIRKFPGNSDDARVQYLKALYAGSRNNHEVQEALEDSQYRIDFAQELLEVGDESGTQQMAYNEASATQFFEMLIDYFDTDYTQPVISWSKFLPIVYRRTGFGIQYAERATDQAAIAPQTERERLMALLMESASKANHLAGIVALRFYRTETPEFMHQVFEQKLPLTLLAAWKALPKDGPLQAWALQVLGHFSKTVVPRLSEKARKRIDQSFDVIQKWVGVSEFPLGAKPASRSGVFLDGRLKIVASNGKILDEKSIWRAYGADLYFDSVSFKDSSGGSAKLEVVKTPDNPFDSRFLDFRWKRGGFLWMGGSSMYASYPLFGVVSNYSAIEEAEAFSWPDGQRVLVRQYGGDKRFSALLLRGTAFAMGYYARGFGLQVPVGAK